MVEKGGESQNSHSIRKEGVPVSMEECRHDLMGEFSHTVDAKGRLIIPSRIREELGEKFIVCKGLDGCLFGYPMDEWHKFEAKLQRLPLANESARQFKRFFLSGAAPCELDKQGRILLPETLREFAGLVKDVVISGCGEKVEIWDKDKWIEINSKVDMDKVAQEMSKLDLDI